MDRWNGFFDVVSKRRSIRKYEDRQVEDEKVRKILEALRLAPSSSNSQPWHVVVVRNKETIQALSEAAPVGSRFVISWMAKAPLVFVLAVRRRLTHRVAGGFGHSNLWLDAGIGGEHLVLAAQALGLGTCWIGWFSEKKVRGLVGLPKSHEVAALIPCGYPAEEPEPRERKRLDEIFSVERFGTRRKERGNTPHRKA
jgi:nitroreductase